MPILDVQRRVSVIGHIRLGERIFDGSRTRPRALKGFRFTTGREALVRVVADAYGGEPKPWVNPSTNVDEWECITKATELPVLVPPADLAFSQHYELWSAGGCERRCDGFTEVRGPEPQPCVCATEGERACQAVTRLSLILPEVAQVFGVWQLVTASYYASGELRSAVELALGMAQRRAEHLAAATLRLEQRVARTPGQAPRRYTMPILDVALDLTALQAPLSASGHPSGIPAAQPTPQAARESVRAAQALTVVGLPEPAPRIDRGAPSPAPGPLDDEGARAPSVQARVSVIGEVSPPELAPHEVGTITPVLNAGDHAVVDAALKAVRDAGIDFERVDDPEPELASERLRNNRRAFAVMAELWPNISKHEQDARRAALGLLTSRARPEPVHSWAQLTDTELAEVVQRLQAIEAGGLTITPTDDGYTFTKASGQALHITTPTIEAPTNPTPIGVDTDDAPTS